jgi:hypothetical protein
VNQLDLLATDFANTFLGDFSETITYTPYGNSPITIRALIDRDVPTAIAGLNGAAAYKHEIMIANSATDGVLVVNKGKDTVILNNKVGGKVETFVVMPIIQNDQGMFHLGAG